MKHLHGLYNWWFPPKFFIYVLFLQVFENIPSGKLTQQWIIPMFNRKYIFKGSMFHCYVCLPECIRFHVENVGSSTARHVDVGKALLKTPMAKVIQPYEAWCQIEGDKWLAQKEQDVSEGLFQKNALGISEMSDHFWRRFQWLDHFWWVCQSLDELYMNSLIIMFSDAFNFELWNIEIRWRHQNLAFQMLQVPIWFFKTKRCSVWILDKAWSNDCKPTTLWR